MKTKFLNGLLIVSILFSTSCQKDDEGANTEIPETPISFSDNDHMLMGNLSNATHSESNPNNYLLRKNYYSASYSRDRGTPNWVSWHLYKADLGSVSRSEDFLPDNSLPSTWYHVQDADYTGSNFDRGHNCPSGDRTSTLDANTATFYTTNLIPQAPKQNQLPWANMENYIRALITSTTEAYIIMGSYGKGGVGNGDVYATTISNGRVTVPSNVWKVVVLIPNGDNDTSRVDGSTRVISVNMPNNNNVDPDWKKYRVSVDDIETATGYDLLSRLPVDIQKQIEAVKDNK